MPLMTIENGYQMSDCPACNGSGSDPVFNVSNTCKLCGGSGWREPDYCVPFYTDPNGKAVALKVPPINKQNGAWEPMRFTLEGARREVMLVRSGKRWWNFPANCIVRVYLK